MKHLFLVVFIAVSTLAQSQSGVMRVELEATINSNIYQVVPCENKGILVFYETREMAGETSKSWYFMFYTPALEPAWNSNIPVVADCSYQDYVLKDSVLSLLFLNTGKARTGTDNFQVVTMDLVNGISYETKGRLPVESNYRKMLVQGDTLCLALNTKNDQAALFFINLKSSQVESFNVLYPDENFIEDICLDTTSGNLVCLIANYLSRRQNKLYLQALTLGGQLVYDMEILPVLDSKYLNTGRIHVLNDGRIMVIGSYGKLAAKIPAPNEYFGVESSGVFSTRIFEKKQEFMNYYNFMEFSNLRAGVSARDYYKLQKKKGRETPEYSLNYEVLVHDLKVKDSVLAWMMEAFYPEFRTESDISYDYWGRPVTQTYTVFDGYRFFNAILAGFNTEGELVWDNSLEINIAPTTNLIKRASFYFDGEPAIIFFNDGSKISYRVYLENAELEAFSKIDLETLHTGDRITAIGFNRMIHWYDHYFLAYGYHTIQNNLLQDKNERSVFYLNKIALE